MRIGIDARAVSNPQRGGYKTYTENLIEALARVDARNQYLIYLDRKTDDGLRLGDNFSRRVIRSGVKVVGTGFREQVILPTRLRLDGVDVAHFPCNTAPILYPGRFVMTIHDVIELLPNRWRNRSLKARVLGWYERFVMALAAKRATLVITDSLNSKRDIVSALGIDPDVVRVIYISAHPRYTRVEGAKVAVKRKYGLDRYILAIGSAHPRKNASGVIEAYLRIKDAIPHQLVLVCTHRRRTSSKRRGIFFLEGVSDEDLCLLYNAAELFVFPSFYEGFGLPPLEAMACGTPVIASNRASLPEVIGDAGILVDPDDVEGMASAMLRVLNDERLQKQLSERGIERAKRFRWEKTAKETVAVYEEAYSM